jgi:hypothetical protein
MQALRPRPLAVARAAEVGTAAAEASLAVENREACPVPPALARLRGEPDQLVLARPAPAADAAALWP